MTIPSWGDFLAECDGVNLVRHAALTFAGTWAAPGQGYPSEVVSGLIEYVSPDLVFEVPVIAPNSFGPIGGGDLSTASYQQSVQDQVDFACNYVTANPLQTVVPIGYSQGGEGASRFAMEFEPGGRLEAYAANLIGGITFGNPCRKAGAHAPTIADPGGRGISSVNMTTLPTVKGEVVWADYVHSPANGDAGLDMYASVPLGQVGVDMTDVYTTATAVQLNDPTAFLQAMVTDLIKLVEASGVLSGLSAGLAGLFGEGAGALVTLISGLVSPNQDVSTATGSNAAVLAATQGLHFLTASGGPTGPHISYLGEMAGYSNLVADAVGFLEHIATLTPARCAA